MLNSLREAIKLAYIQNHTDANFFFSVLEQPNVMPEALDMVKTVLYHQKI